MTQPLQGRTYLITGGSGGIAGGCARALAADGAALLLMARGREALEKRQGELRAEFSGARIEVFAGNAAIESHVEGALAAAHAIAGRFDGVVAIAGGGSGYEPIVAMDAAVMRDSFEKNVISAFLTIRHAAPLMQPGGSIVCISSTAAKINFPWLAPYCTSKAALEALVRAAAEELSGAGIRVNAVRPGLTRAGGTGSRFFPNQELMAKFQAEIPLLRPGIPAGESYDIGAAVRFLSGPESAWITGQSFAVDGGNELRKAPDLGELVEAKLGREGFAAAKKGKPLVR